jgi:hypothetical protein
MKQISAFMSEISDEFKVIVVNAIRSLCLKFPAKQGVMLTFLSGILRDEGGYDFKKAVVEAIFDMIRFISDSKEAGKRDNSRVSLCCMLTWYSRSFGPALRIYRGLRIYQALSPHSTSSRCGRTKKSCQYLRQA